MSFAGSRSMCTMIVFFLVSCLVRGSPSNAEAHRDRAIAFDEAGSMSDAVKHFRLAAHYAPESAAHYVNLATALGDEGFEGRDAAVGERVEALRRALAIDTGNEDALEQRMELTASGKWLTTESADGVVAAAPPIEQWHDKLVDALPPVPIDASDLDDTLADWNKMAIGAAQKGDLGMALGHFLRGSFFESFRGDIWANVLMASADYARQLIEAGDQAAGGTAHAMLCQGRAAASLAMLLKGKPSQLSMDKTRTLLEAHFGGQDKCDGVGAPRQRVETARIAVALSKTDAAGAAKMLCKRPADLTMTLTPAVKRRGLLTAQWLLQYLSISTVCGVVKVANMYDPDFVSLLSAAHQEEFAKDKEEMVGSFEGARIASRGQGRYEIKWPLRKPFTDPKLALNLQLLAMVKANLVGHSLELDTFSHVDSLPGSHMQDWHQDVDAIAKRMQIGEALHTAPQGVVVVVPLVDMTAENGPTEFLPGSHVNLGIDYWKNAQDNNSEILPPSLAIPANVGDCVIFGAYAKRRLLSPLHALCTVPDPSHPPRPLLAPCRADLRIRHRGTPNRSDNVRSIVYMSYVQAWFRDEVNFKGHQTRAWGEEFTSTPARKAFMRLDQRRWVDELERIVAEKGVDVKALRTSVAYKAAEMKV